MDTMNTGGSERQVASTILEIRKITKEFEFKVCVLRNVDNFKWYFEENNIPIDFLNLEIKSNPISKFLKVLNYFRREKPYLVQANQTETIFFLGLTKYFFKAKGIIASILIHELWKMRKELKVLLAKIPCKIAFRNYDSVVCVANSVKNFEAKANFHNPSKLTVIHNGIILSDYENLKPTSDLRKELGIPPETKLILNVGRLDEKKGLRFLVEAMPQILNQFPKTKLLLVGDGDFRTELEARIKRLKLEDSVLLLGLKKVNEVQNIYQNSDIFVFPTLTEALSNVLLESMVNGLPVIATNTGGNPEVIENGKSGILIPLENSKAIADNVCDLLSNPQKMKILSQSASKRVRENFSFNKTVNEYLKLYKSF
ncbi:MAG: glycosyltransferase family 1 protein [Calditrichaeota bacterium]|nr:MAG: glycosyltransferase family 1 protein [Calditrichota bacterium]